MPWRGRCIILVNHQCNICGFQVINFQIFSCSMQHPRKVAYFERFLAVWSLSPPNMTLFCCNFDQRQSMIRQGEPSKLIVLSLSSIQEGGGGEGFKLLTLIALDKLLFSVFRTKEQLQTHDKLTSIHCWFSNALSMPFKEPSS